MAKQTPTPGTCMICNEMVTKRTISQHILKKHKSEHGEERFLIIADTPYSSPYWLALLADPDAELKKLDSLLRAVWLECCGHLSLFTIQGAEFMTTWDGSDNDNIGDADNMHVRLKKLLRPGMKFSHEYDFGTTTELRLKVDDMILSNKSTNPVDVVGMNMKPDMTCDDCGKPAMFHYVDEDEKCVCNTCSENEEEYDESMFLPICNSPRTGMCGYEGGRYDEEPEDE